MYFEVLHDVRSFFGGTFQPYKCLLRVTEPEVGVEECGRRHIALLPSPLKFVDNLQRLRAAATVSVCPDEDAQHSWVAIGKRCRFFQCTDRFIELLGSDKCEAERPQSLRIIGICCQISPHLTNRLIITPRKKKDPADVNAVKCQRIEFLGPSGPSQCFLAPALTYQPKG